MKCAWWLSQGSTSECTTWKGWGPGDGGGQRLSPGGKGMGDVMLWEKGTLRGVKTVNPWLW